MNIQQVQANLDRKAYASRSEYDRTADGNAWNFYPCDGHVIRVREIGSGYWTAALTTMTNREKWLAVCSARGRGLAVACIMRDIVNGVAEFKSRGSK